MPGAHDPRTDALLDPATYVGDLHAVLAELRESTPVAWNATAGFWALTSFADVITASSDPATFCSSRGILVEEIGRTYDSPPTMMHTDPPAHTRYRSLVRPGFTPSVVREMRPGLRDRVERLVDDLAARAADGPVDVVEHLAVPFPIQVIADLLGLPEGDETRLHRWSEAAVPGATDWSEEERGALMVEMATELLGLAAARRAQPRDDVVSMLAGISEDGDALSDDELGMFLIQLLVAGNETTRNATSGGLVALAEHPEQWDRLAGDRSLVPTAVEEVLRWTTPVTSFLRTATRDTELSGVAIAAGDPVLLLYAAANRDPAEFGPDAGRFDAGRHPNHHVAFGFGAHFCLGAALARAELAVVLEVLLDRFERLEPAGPVERTGSSVINGIRHAPLRLHPR
jgi:cytochrome P450